jgi:hypothetical protein
VPAGDAVPRGALLRTLGRGARNGSFLGVGAAAGLAALPWTAAAVIRGGEAAAHLNLKPAAVATVLAVGALAGAAGAGLVRALVRPFGRVAWGWAWLTAGAAVFLGSDGYPRAEFLKFFGRWQFLMITVAPAAAVYWDWWTRHVQRDLRHKAEAGQIPPERNTLLKGLIPVSDLVVRHLPVLLVIGGVTAGHLLGAAVGRTGAPTAFARVGAEFGALAGRSGGALAAALAAMGLLRWYRVEERVPWPGHEDRPYPRGLAALYLVATAALVVCRLL